MDSKKKKIHDFLSTHIICSLSTVTVSGIPEAAAMAFTETDDLLIIFQTSNSTRKYYNLQRNPKVAIVVSFDFEQYISVQYEGIAKEVPDGERERISHIHVAKHSEISTKYANVIENKYFIVMPTWIRYSDLKADPNQIFELDFSKKTILP